MAERVVLDAPAKVNLRLRILGREDTGYHALESIFCAISLADTIDLCRAEPGITLAVLGGVDTGPPERNLAVRAAEAFYRRLNRSAAIAIRMEKRIPAAAGLGGGSSDAAAVLRALNMLEGEPLSTGDLLQIAVGLGADVPFFLAGSPLCLGWGRGERLLALPALPPRPVLVAHPGEAVPTGEAFAALDEQRGSNRPEAEAFALGLVESWAMITALQGNDFQPVVTSRIPVLTTALDAMHADGAIVALLAGSGGCVFGIFGEAADRDRARTVVEGQGVACWSCETLRSMPVPQVDPPRNAG